MRWLLAMLSKAVNLIGSVASIIGVISESVWAWVSKISNLPVLGVVAFFAACLLRFLGVGRRRGKAENLKSRILETLKDHGELALDELKDRLPNEHRQSIEETLRCLVDDRRILEYRRQVSLGGGRDHSVTFYNLWGR